ncbi:sterol desaturase family protein [Thalassomonas haliotis]|uniref:Sterol desaturase family protein n=1 Tax=Thalassomonas haliotis TaxID=485448 RepID=A0ABY7VHS7_9GAMM|nr:sterol desaturase family protein [Thalassomonas haliotis]WDE13078.1 sterol desaturase family protein [Thalassomonas haliotis]
MQDYNINGLAIPLFLVFMLLEYALLRLRGQKLHRFNDSVASLSMGMLLLISDALLKAYTFAVFIYLFEHHRVLEFSPNAAVTWLIFFFAVDFCYYWFHRCAHQFNFLWGAHVGHHQSEEYNLTTALRQSAFQYAFSWIFYLPLALLGCPPQVFLLLFILLKLYQFWLHTLLIDKIPFIEGIFSTPSSHRVHHAKNPLYIDKNYGGTLVIWDRLFGSWQPELTSERCHYGTTSALNTLNPVKANLQHWWLLVQDTINAQSWRDKCRLWFKPTGWRPKDCRNKTTANPVPLQKTGCNKRKKYDPQTSLALKTYVALSMLMIFYLCFSFILLSPSLSAMSLAFGAGLIITGLVSANALLENKLGYLAIESLRLPVTCYFIATLSTPLALAFTEIIPAF